MSYFDSFDLNAISNLDLLARQVVEGFIIGLHKSPFHGFSVEFAEHKHYNPGENINNIDWKVYARTNKLYSKKYEEETNLRCQILVDASSSMFFPDVEIDQNQSLNKFQFAALGAASMMNLLKKQRDAYGLSVFDNEVNYHVPPKSSTAQYNRILTELNERITHPPKLAKTRVAQAMHEIADRIHKRSLVIVFSDMLDDDDQQDELFSALRHLKFNKHEVILFHVVDKSKELDFDFDDRPHEFIDLENDERIRLQPSQVKEVYTQKILERTNEIRLKCLQFKIDYQLADVAIGYHQILRTLLVKRSKMSV